MVRPRKRRLRGRRSAPAVWRRRPLDQVTSNPMDTTQTAPEAGWFQDTVRPWIAHRWDGQQWTGGARGRHGPVPSTTVPSSPAQPARRIEPGELPRRTPRPAPVGVLPLGTGALVVLVLLPSLLDRVQSVIYGAPLSSALPFGFVGLLLAALGLGLYGIVALAVNRAQQ